MDIRSTAVDQVPATSIVSQFCFEILRGYGWHIASAFFPFPDYVPVRHVNLLELYFWHQCFARCMWCMLVLSHFKSCMSTALSRHGS